MNAIKLARVLDNLKAIKVSKQAGMDKATWSLIENGWRKPTAEELNKIRRVLPSYNRAVEILGVKQANGE